MCAWNSLFEIELSGGEQRMWTWRWSAHARVSSPRLRQRGGAHVSAAWAGAGGDSLANEESVSAAVEKEER